MRLSHFFEGWVASFKIYYFSYIVAFVATVLWIISVSLSSTSNPDIDQLLMVCAVAFPLFLLGPLYNHIRQKYDARILIVGGAIAALLSLGFWRYLQSHQIFVSWFVPQSYTIVTLLSVITAWWSVLALLSLVHPYENRATRYWRKELLVYMFIALLGSAILWWGISGSLASISYLFDVTIDRKRYQYVGIVSFLIVGVSILLTNLARTEPDTHYHSFFRFFGLYIFFPLTIVYALILLVYGGKILMTWQRPKGLVSMMVIWYTLFGLLTYLLTYPLKEEYPSVKYAQMWYFVSILAFSLLLFGAIGMRISQYGITESRYLIVMAGIRIIMSGAVSLISPKRSFSTMIFVFLGLTISSAYLPWSASAVSLKSQTQRAEKLLEQFWWRDGQTLTYNKLNSDDFDETKKKQARSLMSTLDYLVQYHDQEAISYLRSSNQDLKPKNINDTWPSINEDRLKTLWLSWSISMYEPDATDTETTSFFIASESNAAFDVSGYSSLFSVRGSEWAKYPSDTDKDHYVTTAWNNNAVITLNWQNWSTLTIDLMELAPQLYQLSLDKWITLTWENYLMIVNNLYGENRNEKYTIYNYDITILANLKAN